MAWGWSGLIFLAFVFRKVRWTGSDEWFGVELFLAGVIVSQSVKVAFELCERSAVVVCVRVYNQTVRKSHKQMKNIFSKYFPCRNKYFSFVSCFLLDGIR